MARILHATSTLGCPSSAVAVDNCIPQDPHLYELHTPAVPAT